MTDESAAIRQVAREVKRARSETREQARASQASFRSVQLTDGPVSYYDEDGVERLRIGALGEEGEFTIQEVNAPAPPQPTAPDTIPWPSAIAVSWDGTFEDANSPADLARVEIHASLVSGFTPTDETQVGTYTARTGGVFQFPCEPAQGTFYFKLVAVNNSGIESIPSDEDSNQALTITETTDGNVPAQVVDVEAEGGIRSVFLRWESVTNADPVHYDVYAGTDTGFAVNDLHRVATVVANRATVNKVYDDVTAAMVDLSPGSTYYFRVVAKDFDGPGLASTEAVGSPVQVTGPDIAANAVTADKIVANAITADKLEANMALLSAILVGDNIAIRPVDSTPGANDNGITVELANGGFIRLPTDGTNAQFLKVLLEANELLVNDNFELRGLINKIAGSLSLAVGVTTPTTAPQVTESWADTSKYIEVDMNTLGIQTIGGLFDNGSTWICRAYWAGTHKVVSVDKATGAVTTLFTQTLSDSYSMMDVVKVGTEWVVLYSYYPPTGTFGYYVQRYNAAWATVGPLWKFTPFVWGDYGDPRMCTDGTKLWFVYSDTSGAATKWKLASTNVDGTGLTINANSTTDFGFISQTNPVVGNMDFGASRVVFCNGSGSKQFVVGTSGSPATRYTANDWLTPSGESSRGLAWDGTNFYLMTYVVSTGGMRIRKLSTITSAVTRKVRYSWYDAVGTTHESAWSPASADYTQNPRSYFRVTTPAPPYQGNVDDPNQIRHYIQTPSVNASYWRQTALANPWIGYYEDPVTSGNNAVSSPDFTGVANPGQVVSAAESSPGVPHIWLKGSGGWRLTGTNETETVFTPTWQDSAGTGLSIGSGTLTATKRRIGDFLICNVQLIRAGDSNQGAGGTHYRFLIGETFANFRQVQGHGFIRDDSAGTEAFVWVRLINSTTLVLYTATGGTRIGNAVPWTWASGDEVNFEVRGKVS